MDAARSKENLDERLQFMGIDEQTRATLKGLQPLVRDAIGPALTAFYDKVRATPATRKFFGDENHMAAAKGHQERHWTLIAAGEFTESYATAVNKIGQAHARIGLEPRWYIGGYALVIEQLIHAVVKDQWPSLLQMAKGRHEVVAGALSSLVKAAMLDMDLAISVYLDILDGQRRQAEEAGKQAIEQEREMVVGSIGVALAKLAGKDLTYRITEDMPNVYHRLQNDFNAAMEQLEAAMQSVAGATDAIHAGTQEISVASDDLSRRTEQQAASLEETAAALDEITVTVKRAAEGATHARQVVAAADNDAKKSAVVVREAVEAMGAISNSAGQISQIIGVIDEIAFQTNLLALNAGVEAARAGDAGRGFAVVASEVRALAQRSAEAAKEIKRLISASGAHVDQGVALVAETGKALERILAQVGEINGIISEIASGAHEQATGLDQVNTAVSQMDQVTQQNAAMVEESTAAGHALTQETEHLSALIGQFEIGRVSEDASLRQQLQKTAPHAFRPKPNGNSEARPAKARANGAKPKAVANGGHVSEATGWQEF